MRQCLTLIIVATLTLGLAGCRDGDPPLVKGDLVVNGVRLPGAGTLWGSGGYFVDARKLLGVLNGSVQEVAYGVFLFRLNGRTFLVSAVETNTPHDFYIRGLVDFIDGVMQLGKLELEKIITVAYPNGTIYRAGNTIYVIAPTHDVWP